MTRIRIPLFAPYQLGCWLAHRWQERCLLCGIHLSQPSIHSYQTHRRAGSHHTNFHHAKTEHGKTASWTDWLGMADTGVLCLSCQHRLPPPPASFSVIKDTRIDIQAAAPYRYPINQLVQAFKFHEDMSRLPILRYLLERLSVPKGVLSGERNLSGTLNGNAVILPMPTTAKRLKKRGFDPVTILSAHLSHHWQIPIWRGVQRIDDTISQRHLNRQERFSNLEHAFAIVTPLPASIRHVLLFDDVATTGASLHSLAHTLLLSHQSLQVSGYCLAHGS